MTEKELARALMQAGRLTLPQVQEAARQRQPGHTFAHVIVSQGLISADEVLQYDPQAFAGTQAAAASTPPPIASSPPGIPVTVQPSMPASSTSRGAPPPLPPQAATAVAPPMPVTPASPPRTQPLLVSSGQSNLLLSPVQPNPLGALLALIVMLIGTPFIGKLIAMLNTADTTQIVGMSAIFTGLLISMLLAICLKIFRIRHLPTAITIGIVACLLGYLSTKYFEYQTIVDHVAAKGGTTSQLAQMRVDNVMEEETGHSGLAGYLILDFSNHKITHFGPSHENDDGISGVSAGVLLLVLDLGIIIGLCWMFVKIIAGLPYCNNCQKFVALQSVAFTAQHAAPQFIAALKANQFSSLPHLMVPGKDVFDEVRVTFEQCPNCKPNDAIVRVLKPVVVQTYSASSLAANSIRKSLPKEKTAVTPYNHKEVYARRLTHTEASELENYLKQRHF